MSTNEIREQPGRPLNRLWRAASGSLIGRVFVAWLATRVAYVIFTYFANLLSLVPKYPGLYGTIFSWLRWDVNWYLLISRHGYTSAASANYFPLFPLVTAAVSWLLGDGSSRIGPQLTFPPVIGGQLVGPPDRTRMVVALALTNLALLVGLYAIARLAELGTEGGNTGAGMRAVWITLAYPFAFSWTAPLSDGFFLAFAAVALLSARQGRWYPAAVSAFLAALTRPYGVILVAPLAWEFARQRDWLKVPLRTRPSWSDVPGAVPGVVVVAAAPVGIGLYLSYLYFRFHDFLLPLHTQLTIWRHRAMPQWASFWLAFHYLFKYGVSGTGLLALELVFLIGSALIIIVAIRRIPFSYTLYMAGLLYVITAAPFTVGTDLFTGAPRYLAAGIPLFLIFAQWSANRPWLEKSLIAGGMMLQGVFTLAFFSWRFL